MDLREIAWTRLIWLRIGTAEASCEGGNKSSGSMKCWAILEYLSNWWFLKKDSAA
jgi:hypothetical protein